MATLGNIERGRIIDERGLAEALGVCVRTLRRMVRRGDIPPAVRLGRKKIWQSDRVLDHLDERAREAEAEVARERKRLRDLSS